MHFLIFFFEIVSSIKLFSPREDALVQAGITQITDLPITISFEKSFFADFNDTLRVVNIVDFVEVYINKSIFIRTGGINLYCKFAVFRDVCGYDNTGIDKTATSYTNPGLFIQFNHRQSNSDTIFERVDIYNCSPEKIGRASVYITSAGNVVQTISYININSTNCKAYSSCIALFESVKNINITFAQFFNCSQTQDYEALKYLSCEGIQTLKNINFLNIDAGSKSLISFSMYGTANFENCFFYQCSWSGALYTYFGTTVKLISCYAFQNSATSLGSVSSTNTFIIISTDEKPDLSCDVVANAWRAPLISSEAPISSFQSEESSSSSKSLEMISSHIFSSSVALSKSSSLSQSNLFSTTLTLSKSNYFSKSFTLSSSAYFVQTSTMSLIFNVSSPTVLSLSSLFSSSQQFVSPSTSSNSSESGSNVKRILLILLIVFVAIALVAVLIFVIIRLKKRKDGYLMEENLNESNALKAQGEEPAEV